MYIHWLVFQNIINDRKLSDKNWEEKAWINVVLGLGLELNLNQLSNDCQ